jgi:hypothetical protein
MVVAALGAVGLVAFFAASVAIGVRCLLLWRRTGGVPEAAVGTGFLVGAVVGYAPETVVLSTDWLAPAGERAVLAVTQVAIRLAAVSVLVFTLHVFRPRELWARAFVGVCVAGLAVSWLAFPSTRIHAASDAERLWYDVFTLFRAGAIAWGSLEAFLHWGKSRRRLRLGLADALVTDRFRLWGVGLGAMTLLMLSTLLAAAAGVDPAAPGWVLLESLAGLVGAATLWLTFFAPASYVRRVRARAGT